MSENLGFLLSSDGNLGVPLELQQVSQALSLVEAGSLGYLLSCNREVGPPLELQG